MSDSFDILDDIAEGALPLSKYEYDRMAKLDEGIKKLTKELEGLKERAKAEYEASFGIVKGTRLAGSQESVVLNFGTRNNKDLEATAAKFPEDKFPDVWKIEKTLDLDAIAPKDIVVIPALTISVTSAKK